MEELHQNKIQSPPQWSKRPGTLWPPPPSTFLLSLHLHLLLLFYSHWPSMCSINPPGKSLPSGLWTGYLLGWEHSSSRCLQGWLPCLLQVSALLSLSKTYCDHHRINHNPSLTHQPHRRWESPFYFCFYPVHLLVISSITDLYSRGFVCLFIVCLPLLKRKFWESRDVGC